MLKNVLGVSAVNTYTVSRWASRVAETEEGQEELSDAPLSGLPTRTITLVLLQCSDELNGNGRQITTRNLAIEPSVS